MSNQEKKPIILVKKSNDSLFSKLREARDQNNGVVTYFFEEKVEFNDYQGNIDKNPRPIKNISEKYVNKWSQSQSINKEVFVDHKGKNVSLDSVVALFRDTCEDLGAKYFTV